jgi:hypothetical protein
MHKVNGAGMALFALFAGISTILAASFLPFFLSQVWGPLWGVEWWPPDAVRSFGRVAPLGGVSQWARLLAVPLASVLVVGAFTLVAASVVLYWRDSASRAR